jgi:putative endonuclease
MKRGYVYILTNKYNTVLYAGVTSDLKERIYEHKIGQGSLFTSLYNVHKLVWFDEYQDIREAIAREKLLKRWRRNWKFDLIRKLNPDFRDLYEEL